MTTFESVHQEEILGSLTTFDRMIFKGYLTGLFPVWRCLGVIRSSVTRILGRHREESAVVYWASLFSYAFSTATYSQLSLELRHLAYLDAAFFFYTLMTGAKQSTLLS